MKTPLNMVKKQTSKCKVELNIRDNSHNDKNQPAMIR